MRTRTNVTLLALLLLFAWPAQAVIIASGDGSGNTTAPVDDFGFANVGVVTSNCSNCTAVYLRNRWVVTAGHVGIGPVTFGGVTYQPVSGSGNALYSSPLTDGVFLFRLQTDPGLPEVQIATSEPIVDEAVWMVGNSALRGTYHSQVDYAGVTYSGWDAGSVKSIRWGTNVIAVVGLTPTAPWDYFYTIFTHPSVDTEHEAQGSPGDSGGGVFVKRGGVWQLIGIMYSAAGIPYQAGYEDPYNASPTNFSTTAAYSLHGFHVEIQNIIADLHYAPWSR